jgi:hypothetical protein
MVAAATALASPKSVLKSVQRSGASEKENVVVAVAELQGEEEEENGNNKRCCCCCFPLA